MNGPRKASQALRRITPIAARLNWRRNVEADFYLLELDYQRPKHRESATADPFGVNRRLSDPRERKKVAAGILELIYLKHPGVAEYRSCIACRAAILASKSRRSYAACCRSCIRCRHLMRSIALMRWAMLTGSARSILRARMAADISAGIVTIEVSTSSHRVAVNVRSSSVCRPKSKFDRFCCRRNLRSASRARDSRSISPSPLHARRGRRLFLPRLFQQKRGGPSTRQRFRRPTRTPFFPKGGRATLSDGYPAPAPHRRGRGRGQQRRFEISTRSVP